MSSTHKSRAAHRRNNTTFRDYLLLKLICSWPFFFLSPEHNITHIILIHPKQSMSAVEKKIIWADCQYLFEGIKIISVLFLSHRCSPPYLQFNLFVSIDNMYWEVFQTFEYNFPEKKIVKIFSSCTSPRLFSLPVVFQCWLIFNSFVEINHAKLWAQMWNFFYSSSIRLSEWTLCCCCVHVMIIRGWRRKNRRNSILKMLSKMLNRIHDVGEREISKWKKKLNS